MYTAPLHDMRFILDDIMSRPDMSALPAIRDLANGGLDAILSEASRLATEVLDPLNVVGDRQGARIEAWQARTPEGFRDAYHQYVQGGWNRVPFDPAYGGQGLPWCVAMAVQEMWQAANTAFSLCPMLNQGAVELLTAHGTEEQKELFLSKLISGEWTGTMNLTEPQAGSDVGAIRTHAVPDGSFYRIRGQKIYITYGDHDLTPNIIHMVLARTPGAPEGTKGLSLFLVPKMLVNADGSLGGRNDVHLVSLEHKVGIHGSPTATLSFGDHEGALGYRIGPEGGGMTCMFTMMNNARLSVGSQGVALAERAYQQARDYARTRIQGKPLLDPKSGHTPTIIHHPDVKRMLMHMRSSIEAGRALVYTTAAALDVAKHHPDAHTRQEAQARADLLTPVAKAWCTDMAVDVASIGIQIHGGMGYIEETGAAQHWRDSRITPIYEGTNGIQANDLVFRKVVRDKGAAVEKILGEMHDLMEELEMLPGDDLQAIAESLAEGITALEDATAWILNRASTATEDVAGIAAPYLELFGLVVGGWLLAKAAMASHHQLAKGGEDAPFHEMKIMTARFFAEALLPASMGLVCAVQSGFPSLRSLREDQF